MSLDSEIKSKAEKARKGRDILDSLINKKGSNVIPISINKPKPPEIQQLPPLPKTLDSLPYGLGKIQDYIYNRMKFPNRALAGITSLALMAHFSQKNTTIDSFEGLTCNEFYMILGGTASGKDDIRKSFSYIVSKVKESESLFKAVKSSNLVNAAPASKQGLHKILEDNNATTFLSDEFAEWLKDTGGTGHKQQALGYIMEIYTSGLSTVSPGGAACTEYKPVKHPRVTLLTTSTAERMLESMTSSHADSGAYNRFVMFIMDTDHIPTRYEGQVYEVPDDVIETLRWVESSPNDSKVIFSREAWDGFKDMNEYLARPLKEQDAVLAGRLSEQAIRIAAYLCLSDRRTEISLNDLKLAYNIRLGIYHRSAAMIKENDVLSTASDTGKCGDQIIRAFKAGHTKIYLSQIGRFSRQFKKLSTFERDTVVKGLIKDGMAKIEGKLLVYCGEDIIEE